VREGDDRYGRFYATVPGWIRGERDNFGEPLRNVRPVILLADSWIRAVVDDLLAAYNCRSPAGIGLTTAEIAHALGLPRKGITGTEDREPELTGLPPERSFPQPTAPQPKGPPPRLKPGTQDHARRACGADRRKPIR
jgi:hypothetical protein